MPCWRCASRRRGLQDGEGGGAAEGSWQPWFLPSSSGVRLSDFRRGLALNLDVSGGRSHSAGASWAAWYRLKSKLEGSQSVLGVGIASSVLGIHGGCTSPAPQFASLCPICCRPRTSGNPKTVTGSVASFGRGWARVGVDFLRQHYGGAVEFLNYARPGGTAQMFNHCLRKWAPDMGRADFVVLEFNVVAQDAQSEGGRAEMREVEGVLRQLLRLPQPPAIIVMNFFNWCRDVPALCEQSNASDAMQDLSPMFTRTGRSDSRLRELAAHYGVPVASALVSFWPLYFPGIDPVAAAEGRPSGLLEQPVFMRLHPGEGVANTQAHYADGIHPTVVGNTVFGPWFAYVLDQVLSTVSTSNSHAATSTGSLTWDQLPLTLYGPRYSRASSASCFDFASVPLLGDTNKQPSNISLAPYSSKPDIEQMGSSKFFASLPKYAFVNPAEILSSSGFVYVEMVPAADGTLRWKPGIEAENVGAYVDLAYRYTREEEGVGEEGQPDSEVCLTYLASYEHMGKALISCAEECSCEAAAFSAHQSQHISVERSVCRSLRLSSAVEAPLTAAGGADDDDLDGRRTVGSDSGSKYYEDVGNMFDGPHRQLLCVVHVEVVSETESEGHHMKLIGFTVRAAR